jgi:putative flavoprotein involved in K+ transport
MLPESVETLVIGAGQAGLAASEHLGALGLPHLVVERARIAERWRSERWDSLVANGPAWHDRFPSLAFEGMDPDAFAPRDRIVAYFEAFSAQIGAPVRCGVAVTALRRGPGGSGFLAQTSEGALAAKNVIVATGPFQRPVIPEVVPAGAGFTQLHSSAYRSPAQLPEGGVLVIGAGSSGTQIADELRRSGRKVFLSVGPHERPPRRYRGRDFVWWLGALGVWDLKTPGPDTEHVTIAVSGAHGGHTVDFRALAWQGVTLVGRAESFADGRVRFAPDLAQTIARGDASYLAMLDAADELARRERLDLPEEPEARLFPPDPPCLRDPITELDLAAEGVTTILWATGYALDFGWLEMDALDARGRPVHQRGASKIPGLYFLGLSWLSRRASAFIWGVWHDAKFVAEHIAAHRD